MLVPFFLGAASLWSPDSQCKFRCAADSSSPHDRASRVLAGSGQACGLVSATGFARGSDLAAGGQAASGLAKKCFAGEFLGPRFVAGASAGSVAPCAASVGKGFCDQQVRSRRWCGTDSENALITTTPLCGAHRLLYDGAGVRSLSLTMLSLLRLRRRVRLG